MRPKDSQLRCKAGRREAPGSGLAGHAARADRCPGSRRLGPRRRRDGRGHGSRRRRRPGRRHPQLPVENTWHGRRSMVCPHVCLTRTDGLERGRSARKNGLDPSHFGITKNLKTLQATCVAPGKNSLRGPLCLPCVPCLYTTFCVRAIVANSRADVPVPGPMDPDPTSTLLI
jgi:hypothetical protein